ncbi:MAG: ribosomal-processing cysteine protease Prp [Clostridiales bacterium]|nr:ribosomal-processing cysteine protease Prp [Clostridiales bacterium]
MITISFTHNANGVYNGFKTKGHAGYAESGYDIVCSAVSVLIINTINSIETFTSDQFDLIGGDVTSKIEFVILSEVSKESTLLLNSLALGLNSIVEEYGQDYIELKV